MAISGQKTVTTAGTAERLATDQPVHGPVQIRALPGNTQAVYLGNVSDDVASTNGLALSAGQEVNLVHVSNLRELWLDSAVNGEGVSWLILAV